MAMDMGMDGKFHIHGNPENTGSTDVTERAAVAEYSSS